MKADRCEAERNLMYKREAETAEQLRSKEIALDMALNRLQSLETHFKTQMSAMTDHISSLNEKQASTESQLSKYRELFGNLNE